jgi:hypothetical protein
VKKKAHACGYPANSGSGNRAIVNFLNGRNAVARVRMNSLSNNKFVRASSFLACVYNYPLDAGGWTRGRLVGTIAMNRSLLFSLLRVVKRAR